MTRKLQDAVQKQKKATKKHVPQIYGMLGIPIGGAKTVEVPNRNSYVYVRLRNNQSEVIQAFNNKVSPAYDLPVIVERHGGRYTVMEVDTQRYENNWTNFSPYLPRHGNTHSFDPESGGGGDIVFVHSRQFIPGLVFPSGSIGGPNVVASPYLLKRDNNTWVYTGNTGTPNITQYRPSSPTGAVMVLVYLDSVSGNYGLIVGSGTVFPNSLTGTSQVAPFIPALSDPTTQIPLAAVRLVTGTSQIVWNNLYDARQFLHTVPTGSGGGGSFTGSFDDTYLRLDTANNPLTDTLQIRPPLDTRALDIESEGDAVILDFVQITSPAGILTTPAAQFSRDEADTDSSVESPFIKFNQNFDLGGVGETASLLEYYSNSVLRTSINPSAQGTGTNAMFDGDFTLSTGGNLLLLKNASIPKFRVDAAGYIQFGLDVAKEDNAGKIGYHLFGSGYLDIVGAGLSGGDRWVRIYDNLKVDSHLQTNGFQNLGLTSHFVYLNATGTFVTPSNAPNHTFVSGSYSILGLDSSLNSVRFSASQLINDVSIPGNGWISCSEVWTRTGNHTFTLVGDRTTKYRKGTKVRYDDSGNEYGVISSSSHAAGVTTVNLIVNTDFAMSGSPSSRSISYIENPEDWPDYFNFTPTIASTAGTITSYSIGTAKWKAIGTTLFEDYLFTISNNGTGAGAISVGLAATLVDVCNGVGKNASTGAQIAGAAASGSAIVVTRYDGAYPAATGNQLRLSTAHEF